MTSRSLERLAEGQIEYFRTFGFAVLRNLLDQSTVTELQAEADHVVKDATGDRYLVRDDDGGIEGHYIPASCVHTPVSLRLLSDLAPLAEALLGVPLLFASASHILYFDMAGWHSDTGHAIKSVKIVAYLEPLDADNGALRVLPCSHLLAFEQLAAGLQNGPFRDPDQWRDATVVVPSHILPSSPGDVIVFDEHLWHASAYGRNRSQWSANYVQSPTTAEEKLAVSRYLASQFVRDNLEYDPVRYPHYGEYFRRVAPQDWVEQLGSLGAFAAATAEEQRAHGDRVRGSLPDYKTLSTQEEHAR